TKLLYTVPEVVDMTTLSRSVIYELIRTGRLGSVQQGRRRLIPADALTAYIHLLADEAGSSRG
ncbi:MAG: helix-turn-helix domain-containing protein, partial [Janthinobacterium lividum]